MDLNEKKELNNYVSKIKNILGRIKNVTVEVEVTSFDVYELEDSIGVFMNITDDTGSMVAFLVGDRAEKIITDFVTTLNSRKKFKDIINCKIRGDICILDKEMSEELTEKKIILKDVKLGDNVLIVKAVNNIGIEYETFFGKNFLALLEYNLKDLFVFLNENTDYLKDIQFDEVQDIKINRHKDICVLLKSGKVMYNGEYFIENIKTLWFTNLDIYAISDDKKIIAINNRFDVAKFLNAGDYKYKKIIINRLTITALSYDGEIKVYGYIVDPAIDYKRFYGVDDIGYSIEKKEVMVFKNNDVMPLILSNLGEMFDESKIVLNGKSTDKNNYFEIF